jgi:hypothetical protein
VFSGHVRLPIKPRSSRAFVGECATPTLHGPPHPPPQVLAAPSERRHVPGVYCVSLLYQHRRVWVTARRAGR